MAEERDAKSAMWGLLLLGGAIAALLAGELRWFVTAIPVWIMAVAELLKNDHEELNLIKLLGFGLLPFGALFIPVAAGYFYFFVLLLWALFVFIERDEDERIFDIWIATPIILGTFMALFPEFTVIFLAAQFAIFGTLLLIRGKI